MTLQHKSEHPDGMDTFIMREISRRNLINKKLSKDYYFFVYDYACLAKNPPENFYTSENNETNTWNFGLNHFSTRKDQIMKDNLENGLGNLFYSPNDEKILAKGADHLFSLEKNFEAHLVSREIFEREYDKTKYVGQKILRSKGNGMEEELNIYVFRDLSTRKLTLIPAMIFYDFEKCSGSRKKAKNANYILEDRSVEEILGEKYDNFLNYMNRIGIDYGRIELKNDIKEGWCVIDINDSPGGGPLTNIIYPKLAEIIAKSVS